VLWKWSENWGPASLFPLNVSPAQLVHTDACYGGSFGGQGLTQIRVWSLINRKMQRTVNTEGNGKTDADG
jgi:hypothetical protein